MNEMAERTALLPNFFEVMTATSDPSVLLVFAIVVVSLAFFSFRHVRTAVGARQPVKHITASKDQLWPKEPPCTTPFLGHQLELAANADRFLHLFLEWRTTYGLGYEITIPKQRFIDANHPVWLEFIQKDAFHKFGRGNMEPVLGPIQRTGIFNSDGKRWQVQRKAATHAFSRNHFQGPIREKVGQHVKIVVDLLDNLSKTDKVFDFQDLMARFTMLLSLSIGFSDTSGLSHTLTADPACLEVRSHFTEAFDHASPLIDLRTRDAFWRVTERLYPERRTQIDKAAKGIYDFVEPLVKKRLEERKKTKPSGKEGDILDLFCERETDVWTLSGWMASMLFAGRDTTAFSLSWFLYEVLRRPNEDKELLTRLRREIEEQSPSLGEDVKAGGETIDYDEMKDFRFLTAAWQETTRLHPALARGTPTLCYESTELPAIPACNQPAVVVKKGDIVFWQDWVLSRLPEIWGDDCHEFVPERFLDGHGNPISTSQWKWHSFNGGPRVCLGKNLAGFEAMSLLTVILSRYDFEMSDPDMEAMYTVGMNMGIKQGLHVRVRRRQDT